jgi:two-component system nitrogen regulation sensor histidine kinase NtrY
MVTVSSLLRWGTGDESLASNVVLFSIINLNVIGLLVLAVLVTRNLIKLFFERRKGILGSKLRARLMGSFVLIAIIPMTLSFVVASGLINQAIQSWFNVRVESIVASSLTMAKDSLSATKMAVVNSSEAIATAVEKYPGLPPLQILEELRRKHELFSIKMYDESGRMLGEVNHPTSSVDSFAEPPPDVSALRKALKRARVVRIEERGASQFVRVYSGYENKLLVVSFRVAPELVHARNVITDAVADYKESKGLKDPIQTNFFLVLALFNLLTLFGAVWVSFFISKQITGPIQLLIQGAYRVAQGNYDFSVKAVRDDELGYLVNSFNHMIEQLNLSKRQLEQRRLLLGTIISNLGVGVISLNQDLEATTINDAARTMLDLNSSDTAIGAVPFSALLSEEQYAPLRTILDGLRQHEGAQEVTSAAKEIRFQTGGRELLIVCTGGRISTEEGETLGYVLLLDDITDLSRSQHLAAWRDVARRIAHEIKNPLTPLQLSAQRLEKLVANNELSESVVDSTRSIVEHVAIIKRLANEFSEYGRMPMATFSPTRLDILLLNILNQARSDYPRIRFTESLGNKMPEMLLDPDQIRGVFMNLIANAVAALDELPPESRRVIELRASFDSSSAKATIEVIDTGIGISAEDKSRVFEPYFSRKKGGTGLGLAIVSSIISDHCGDIRVFDNEPQGVRFVVTLPQHPQPGTNRRI